MYTKVDTKFDSLSKVFAQLSDDDQNRVVQLVHRLVGTQNDLKEGSAKTIITAAKRKTAKKSETK